MGLVVRGTPENPTFRRSQNKFAIFMAEKSLR